MSGRQWPITSTTLWDGRTVFCRGTWEGLPVFGWRGRPCAAPRGLLTRRQLRAKGLRPGGQDPVALLLFWHRQPYRRQELCSLYREELAVPVRPMTPAKEVALAAALRARQFCQTHQGYVDHCVRGAKKQCAACFDADEMTDYQGRAA
ncbi:RRQRL motif-containing zinc-binding protein [Lentzea tibetensis]|uniref:RRQRL motif-containing zinc-binding protein n=1 Tax=Lentzea tibetensis TaxID=2591470 RepID=UPI0016459328|nr:RRQRL motif-containing zinc-binding protein [Lentzea tibetensis]